MDEKELLKRLKMAFKEESEERLLSMSNTLLELDKCDSFEEQLPFIEIIYREAHSLKGATRAVNMMNIERIFHAAEALLGELKEGNKKYSDVVSDVLYDSLKLVNEILEDERDDLSDYDKEIDVLVENLTEINYNTKIEPEKEKNIEEIVLKIKEEIEEDIKTKTPVVPTPTIPSIPSIPTIPSVNKTEPLSEPKTLEPPKIPSIPTFKEESKPKTLEPPKIPIEPTIPNTINWDKEEPVSEPEIFNSTKRFGMPSVSDIINSSKKKTISKSETIESPKIDSIKPTEEVQIKPVEKPIEKKKIVKKEVKKKINKNNKPVQNSSSVRISTDKLDGLLLKAEELISLKLISTEHSNNLKHSIAPFENWDKEYSKASANINYLGKLLSEDSAVNDKLRERTMNMLSFFKWQNEQFKEMKREMRALVADGENNSRFVGKMVEDFLDEVKSVAMLPFSTLLDSFPIMIRDLSKELNKSVVLNIIGADIEIDKRILEEIKDPLVHILRNSVDHGIEKPAERNKLGKDEKGTIDLKVKYLDGKLIEIKIVDDGAGIDLKKLKQSAVEKGVLTLDEADLLDEKGIIDLIFSSGLSTSQIVTEISGRGLGCAILKDNIEKLGGSIEIKTVLKKGTSFRIVLPVALSTYRGILIKSKDQTFVLPSSQVEQAIKTKVEEVQIMEDKLVIHFDEKIIPLVNMGEVLNLENHDTTDRDESEIKSLLLGRGGKQIAFEVDDVLGERDIIIKDLGPQLKHVKNVSGASVLGSGKVVPILNVKELLDTARGVTARQQVTEFATENPEVQKKRILVVEDSITSRMLLKSILEGAGYKVSTAFDGLAGYSFLKSNEVDLVVTDVEMPRMTGFELCAKIKSDSSLKHLPVIIVTSLATEDDKERGIDSGANAYIVKGSFEQNNLLEAIERFV